MIQDGLSTGSEGQTGLESGVNDWHGRINVKNMSRGLEIVGPDDQADVDRQLVWPSYSESQIQRLYAISCGTPQPQRACAGVMGLTGKLLNFDIGRQATAMIKRVACGYRDVEYFFLKIKAAFPGNA